MTSATTFAAPGAARSELETSTIRAISWRLIPFLVLAYFFSYLDRVNLSFAALTMNAELKFSPTVFAWGAGIFFIGYFALPVLVGDAIVAALDLKTDRQNRKLLLQKWNWVGNAAKGPRKELKRKIEDELHRFERFQLGE